MFLNLTIVDQATQPFINTIIGPLLGAFTGVFLGFLINTWQRGTLDSKRELFFKNLILNEIETSISILEKATDGLLPRIPDDVWTSLVNSGDITLFTDRSALLYEHYFLIQRYNNKYEEVIDPDVKTAINTVLTRLRLTQQDLNEPNIKADDYGAYYTVQ